MTIIHVLDLFCSYLGFRCYVIQPLTFLGLVSHQEVLILKVGGICLNT